MIAAMVYLLNRFDWNIKPSHERCVLYSFGFSWHAVFKWTVSQCLCMFPWLLYGFIPRSIHFATYVCVHVFCFLFSSQCFATCLLPQWAGKKTLWNDVFEEMKLVFMCACWCFKNKSLWKTNQEHSKGGGWVFPFWGAFRRKKVFMKHQVNSFLCIFSN